MLNNWGNIFLGLAIYDSIKNPKKRKLTDEEKVAEIKNAMSVLDPPKDYLDLQDRFEHFCYYNDKDTSYNNDKK